MVDWKSIQDIAEDILYNDNDNDDDDDDDDTEDTIHREIIGAEVAATTDSFPHNNYRHNHDDCTVRGDARSFFCCWFFFVLLVVLLS